MELTSLTAVSPVDGRYRKQAAPLADYFSEYALIRYRMEVEIAYLEALAAKRLFPLPAPVKKHLRKFLEQFSEADAARVKEVEKTTNHDVKAVEYILKAELEKCGGASIKEWVHFGLTSQDINNTAIPLSWKEAMELEYLPALLNLQHSILKKANEYASVPLLARTHGQPASPTRMGKEWMVFAERIENQVQLFSYIPFMAKFGGATGNFNAHAAAFPQIDWIKFANQFTETKLGLQRQQYTTQIEHYDTLGAHFDAIKRINTILIDFCRDIWTYISMDYFNQRTRAGEVGSSAMPHKVNPIDFENAEGNLGIANALLEHFSAKLPVSRLQRDLTDSTVLRNIGIPIAHTLIAIQSIEKGLGKLTINKARIEADLNQNWAVVAEGIQTILRREQYPAPYEALKELTRGKVIDEASIRNFIDQLNVSAKVKKELKKLKPATYTGITN